MRVFILFECFIVILFTGVFINDNQEYKKFWPDGKVMALSLTFDDARASQVDQCIPIMDKYGVKGTFYVLTYKIESRLEAWKKAVKNGHEIGNHSLMHICSINLEPKKEGLEFYTLDRMRDELAKANKLIESKLGITTVSFAYPCGQTFIGRGTETRSFVPLISTMFETGRGWLSEAPNDPFNCDMAQLTGMKLDGMTFDQVKPLIESAKKLGKWLVLVSHEITPDGSGFSTNLSTIEEICRYASDPANGIWIDNVHTIASYIRDKRGETFAGNTDVRLQEKGYK